MLAFVVVLAGTSACEGGPANGSLDQVARAGAKGSDHGADPGGFLPTVCWGQERLRFWRRFDPLTVTDEELERTKGTDGEWSVVVDHGDPVVVATKRQRPATVRGFVDASAVEKGAPGYLVGYDHGEWGGSLSWRSLQGAWKQTLLDTNVRAIVRTPEHFVALTTRYGNGGQAYEVVAYFDRFEVGRMVELPGAPKASVVEPGGTVLIATDRGLFRLSPAFELTSVLEAYWSPRSLTLDGNTVYVGMYGEVAVVKLSGKQATVSWFLPP